MPNVHVITPPADQGSVIPLFIGVAVSFLIICGLGIYVSRALKSHPVPSRRVERIVALFAVVAVSSVGLGIVLAVPSGSSTLHADVVTAIEDQLGVEFIGDAEAQVTGFRSDPQTLLLDTNGVSRSCTLGLVEKTDEGYDLLVLCGDDGRLSTVDEQQQDAMSKGGDIPSDSVGADLKAGLDD